MDLTSGKQFDLLKRSLRSQILSRLEAGTYQYVHLGPPGSSFSTARCPPVRSREHPFGKPGLSARDTEKNVVGNRLALFSLRVMRLCARLGIPCSLEQPASSWMLKLLPVLRATRRLDLHTYYCTGASSVRLGRSRQPCCRAMPT